jgi:hypothetical protein
MTDWFYQWQNDNYMSQIILRHVIRLKAKEN